MPVHTNSTEIYREMQDCGYISHNALKAWSIIERYPHRTAMEIDVMFEHDKERPQAPPRITELKEAGLIEESGKRDCAVTGHTASTYVVTYQKPKSIPRWPTKADWQRDASALGAVEELLSDLGRARPTSFTKLTARLRYEGLISADEPKTSALDFQAARRELIEILLRYMQVENVNPAQLETLFPQIHILGRTLRRHRHGDGEGEGDYVEHRQDLP